jgi:hypothetical protein
MQILYILWPFGIFGIFSTVLVYCDKKNLATLYSVVAISTGNFDADFLALDFAMHARQQNRNVLAFSAKVRNTSRFVNSSHLGN